MIIGSDHLILVRRLLRMVNLLCMSCGIKGREELWQMRRGAEWYYYKSDE